MNIKSKEAFEKYMKDTRSEIENLSDAEIQNIILADKKRMNQEPVVTEEEIAKKKAAMIDLINLKIDHSFEVATDTKKVAIDLGFKYGNPELAELSGLAHDAGRFLQTKVVGNQFDPILSEYFPGVQDHGDLGKLVLEKGLLQKVIPFTRSYDSTITTIVGEHARAVLPEHLNIQVKNLRIFANYTAIELATNPYFNQFLTAMITQIIRDVDRLDIYHQILKPNKPWKPLIVDEKISPEVFNMFFKGEYLEMKKLRGMGLWNANVGELVRLGFISQLKLVSVARIIEQEALIKKMYEVRNIEERSAEMPLLKEAFAFAEHQLKQMKANSEDGIYLGKPSKKR